mmetsp:Transcript_37958/g.80380  ORF Transcript_37958/g.80380 Transcript_37958/m.80380 type:complete len:212 (+) Transcript_37958:78-713(+)
MMRSTPAKKRSDVYWGSSALADDAGKFRGHDLTYAKRNLDGMYECESPTPQNAYNKKKEAMSSRSGCSDRKGFGVIQKVWLAHLADCSVVACQATCQCQLELGRCQELGARAWIVDRLASYCVGWCFPILLFAMLIFRSSIVCKLSQNPLLQGSTSPGVQLGLQASICHLHETDFCCSGRVDDLLDGLPSCDEDLRCIDDDNSTEPFRVMS